MDKKHLRIIELGEKYESFSFRVMSSIVSRLLHGYFLFKRRKGEIVAGATTFFCLLSFCPSIFLMISLIGYFSGDVDTSRLIVMDSLKESFPALAPWIYKSISSIVDQQLKTTTSFNVVNIVFLGYSLLGVVSAFMYGINAMVKGESKGGFIIEDARSFLIGSSVATFMVSLIALTNKTFLKLFVFSEKSIIPSEVRFLFESPYFSIIAAMTFFTLFYRISSRGKSTLKKSFIGACSFVSCFLLGKSFYWVYLNVTKAELSQSYGNFYTLVIAALWIFFLVCSFFYGACVATVSREELDLERKESVEQGQNQAA